MNLERDLHRGRDETAQMANKEKYADSAFVGWEEVNCCSQKAAASEFIEVSAESR
jgi:hypothetical protein